MTAAPLPSDRSVRVRVAGTAVALAAADVTEIVRRPRMIRVPHGPSRLAGLANLRGVATPIFDLAGLLGRSGEGAWAVVLNRAPAIALLVDRVESVSGGDAVAQGFLTVGEGGDLRPMALDALLDGQSAGRQALSVAHDPLVRHTGPARGDAATVGLLAFTLAGQNYALPLTDIIEVAPLPARVRRGRGAALGRMTIRDRKIDLVSLRALLGLGDAAIAGGERVVVVDVRGSQVGLVVEGARVILRAPEASIGVPPAMLNRDDDDARIQSVMRMEDGRGVVSVLTVASLFDGEASGSRTEASLPQGRAAAEEVSRFIIFRIGHEEYGYPVEDVAEIVRSPKALTRVPGAPDHIAGAVNLRGAVVPILDQRRRFGADAADGSDGRILVVDFGGTRAGLLVDGVSHIRQVGSGQIGAAPELPGGGLRLFDRVITPLRDEDMILVVDPAMLLNPGERAQLAAAGGASGETARP